MKNLASYQFNNNRSVRFNLESFALPVAINHKKNTIYTNSIINLKGTKRELLPAPAPAVTYGYTYVARWGNWVFTADSTGLYYADQYFLQFNPADQTLNPQQLCVANDRLFTIGMNRKRLVYSVDLKTTWQPGFIMEGVIHLPENYGLCQGIRFYRNNLLVICENGLLTVDRHLTLRHLTDDNELLLADLTATGDPTWVSDWFSLGYATDTQALREVFLKTDVPLTLLVTSNRTQRTIRIKAAPSVQKIKTNLKGDQFKLAILPHGAGQFCVSNLAAIVAYGKRR